MTFFLNYYVILQIYHAKSFKMRHVRICTLIFQKDIHEMLMPYIYEML